jgi:dTDP-4-amino-4,6-dideoxygalactose transaminase
MDAVLAIAKGRNLMVLEDCAQAHDAEYKGRKVGTFGRAAAFSFYPAKNLGAYGEGGAMLTNDDEIARIARMLRDHGAAKRYHHEFVGYNYRMHGFQGAVRALITAQTFTRSSWSGLLSNCSVPMNTVAPW